MIQEMSKLCILVLMVVLTAGCASTTGLERAERTSGTMETVEDNITRTLDDIDGIETTLQELTRSGQRDISSVFERYSSHVENLEENGDDLISNSQEMYGYAEEYFTGWEQENQEYENTTLQEIGEERRVEVQENYEEIETVRSRLESNLESYINSNRELQTFLSNDLTASGIESVIPVVEDILQESDHLREELNYMHESVGETRTGMERRGRY